MMLGKNYMLRSTRKGDVAILPRAEDCREWEFSVQGGVAGNLEKSIQVSTECWTIAAAANGWPHIIFGVARAAPRAVTWLLASDIGQRDAWWLMGAMQEFTDGLFKRWPRTVCYSAVENTVHHRWLEWLQYKRTRSLPWGPYHHEFIEYIREPADV